MFCFTLKVEVVGLDGEIESKALLLLLPLPSDVGTLLVLSRIAENANALRAA